MTKTHQMFMPKKRTKVFELGDFVIYQYGDTTFVGTVIAKGWRLSTRTGKPCDEDADIRYMVQQDGSGIIHVYGPKYLDWYDK